MKEKCVEKQRTKRRVTKVLHGNKLKSMQGVVFGKRQK